MYACLCWQLEIWLKIVIYLSIYLSNRTHIYLSDLHIYIRGAFNKFPDFLVQAFKIVVDSWKFNIFLLYILRDDWLIFMISGLNEQLQQQLEYTLLKPDCHSWWISKMQSGCEDTLEERYAIKFCFKLGKKIPQKRMECLRLLFDHLAWIEHEFLSCIRDSRNAGSLRGMMRGVGGVRKSIHQSWLAKGFGLLCWGFKGVQEEIPSEKASALQIGSVAFPPRQCISPLLGPCHRLFDKDWHQDSSSPSLLSRPLSLWFLVIPDAQRQWKRLWRRSLTRSHKRTSMVPSRSYWNGTTSALHPEEITSKESRVLCA